jgi:hypothetical protein
VIEESQVEDPERSSLKASCAIDHSYLPNNVHVNHLWDLIGYPSLVYLAPCLPLNYWVVSAIALCGFGCYDTYYS